MGSLELPPLPYNTFELEPYISTEIMALHHGTHHAGYVNNYNKFNAESMQPETPPDRLKELEILKKFNMGGELLLLFLRDRNLNATYN